MGVCNPFDLLLIVRSTAATSSTTTGAFVYIVRSDAVANRYFTPDLTAIQGGCGGDGHHNYLKQPSAFVIMVAYLV